MLSTLYAAAARRRRERYARRPDLRLRLRRPVISVGNLAVGGRGKTPLTCYIAALLLQKGERPAVLSRGYRRRQREAGPVVVRDAGGMRADLARSGDEPLMLARQLPGAAVLTCPDRYAAGRYAEEHLGATVHVLDDGFQHLRLERDIDLLLLAREDIEQPRTLPGGRLREPLDAMIAADAILTTDEDLTLGTHLDVPLFRLRRSRTAAPPDSSPVLAIAGIAEPERFLNGLRAAGWNLAESRVFRDHHAYSRSEVEGLLRLAERINAARIVTTEKDLVRLLPFRPFRVPVQGVPLRLEPVEDVRFREWLLDALSHARDAVSEARNVHA